MGLGTADCQALRAAFPALQNTLGGSCAGGDGALFTADARGNCVAISMPSLGLSGTLPDLSSLVSLTYLDLHNNSFEGEIPASWSSLAPLSYLNLQGNNLVGLVPDWITTSNAFVWGSLSGNFQNVAAGKNADGRLQIFSYTSTTIETFHQLTPNNFSWSSNAYSFGSLSRSPCNVVVGQSRNGKFEIFTILNETLFRGMSGGNVYHYSQTSANGLTFSGANPSIGFTGWTSCKSVAASDSGGKVHFIGVSGPGTTKPVKEVVQKSVNADDWFPLIAAGYSANIDHVACALNGLGKLEIWGFGTSGLKNMTQTGSVWPSGAQSWTTTSVGGRSFTKIYAFREPSGEVNILLITESNQLLYTNSFTSLAGSVKSAKPILNPSNTTLYLFMLTTSNTVKFMTKTSARWSRATEIPGRELTAFDVVFRSDGKWHLFGVNGTGPIHHATTPQ
ncbi:hypothetical protein BDR26DRAFT_406347 [Obelidium mucronatum]|nr:hypothetical protein BDR26DRAFT_406347 [Obelidium mucronatum]